MIASLPYDVICLILELCCEKNGGPRPSPLPSPWTQCDIDGDGLPGTVETSGLPGTAEVVTNWQNFQHDTHTGGQHAIEIGVDMALRHSRDSGTRPSIAWWGAWSCRSLKVDSNRAVSPQFPPGFKLIFQSSADGSTGNGREHVKYTIHHPKLGSIIFSLPPSQGRIRIIGAFPSNILLKNPNTSTLDDVLQLLQKIRADVRKTALEALSPLVVVPPRTEDFERCVDTAFSALHQLLASPWAVNEYATFALHTVHRLQSHRDRVEAVRCVRTEYLKKALAEGICVPGTSKQCAFLECRNRGCADKSCACRGLLKCLECHKEYCYGCSSCHDCIDCRACAECHRRQWC